MSRERSCECRLIGKAAHSSNFGNRKAVIFKKGLRSYDSSVAQIVIKGRVGEFFEESCEVELGEADEGSSIFKAYIIHVVGVDISDKASELIEVLVLLVVSEVDQLKGRLILCKNRKYFSET